MKRLILLATILFVVSSSYAANKMSMVTYFPVPYVAYSQVSADQQLDVGLTSACNMNLGCSESDVNLKAHTVNLQKGKLELNNGKGVFGQSISLGNGNGSGQVRFNNVRMQGGEMQSLNVDSMNVQSLELFGKPFPACKGKGGSDGQMKWTELSLQGAAENTKELYLVCGEVSELEDEPEPEEECTLSWAACFEQGGKDFDEATCSCVDTYRLQYRDVQFAFAVFPESPATDSLCLSYGAFKNVKGRTSWNFANQALVNTGQKSYALDTKQRFPTRWVINYMVPPQTPREMIYQCSFTKNVQLKKMPCSSLDDRDCIADLCQNTAPGTILWDAKYMQNNASIDAFQPRSSIRGDADENASYCCNGLYVGPAMQGFEGYPCMSFNVRFYVCHKNMDSISDVLSAIVDTNNLQNVKFDRGGWVPNTSVKVQVIN